ncbi:MAG TPA: hypothetical protein VD932_02665 [Aquabacterium sp.]|nr:hypothetical protein [Aquabacterium sp.]
MRLLESEAIYCEGAAELTPIEHVGICHLVTSEQPLKRHIAVTTQARTLDDLCGGMWVKGASMLWLLNAAGQDRQTRPTPEEQARIESAIVEVLWKNDPDPVALVRPGRACRFEPLTLEHLRLRSNVGARCVLVLYPR